MNPKTSEKLRQHVLHFIEQTEFFNRFEHVYANNKKILFLKIETQDVPALKIEAPHSQIKAMYPDILYVISTTNALNMLDLEQLKLALFRILARIPKEFNGRIRDFDIKAFKEEANFFYNKYSKSPKFQQIS